MPKPTNLALWATTGVKTEPSAGEKAAGWDGVFKPPFQWFNWWMNIVYTWVVWLDAYESTVHTWTAIQTHSASVNINGGMVIMSDVAMTGTFEIEDGAVSLIGSTDLSMGGGTGRLFVDGLARFGVTGTVELLGPVSVQAFSTFIKKATFNAANNANGIEAFGNANSGGGGGGGAAIRATAHAGATGIGGRFTIPSTGDVASRAIEIYKETVAAPNTPDAAFTGFIADIWGLLKFRGADPLPGAALLRSLSSVQVCKAWINYTCRVDGTVDYNDGCNFQSPVHVGVGVGATAETRFLFVSPMLNTEYAIMIAYENGWPSETTHSIHGRVVVGAKNTAGFVLHYAREDGTAQSFSSLEFAKFSVHVMGRQ